MKNYLLLGILCCLSLTMQGQNTWLGLNTNWNDATNWTAGIPTSVSYVRINNGPSNFPVLTGNVTVHRCEMNGGTISLGSYELKSDSSYILLSTLNSTGGKFTTAEAVRFGRNTISGAITLEIDKGYLYGNVFNNALTLIANAPTSGSDAVIVGWIRPDTFKGETTFINKGPQNGMIVGVQADGGFDTTVFEQKFTFRNESTVANATSVFGNGEYTASAKVVFKGEVVLEGTHTGINQPLLSFINAEFRQPVTVKMRGGAIRFGITQLYTRSVVFQSSLLLDTPGTTVEFGDGFTPATMSAAGTISVASGQMTNGELRFYKYRSLTTAPQLIQLNGSGTDSTYTTRILTTDSTDFAGAVYLRADRVQLNGGRFAAQTTVEQLGASSAARAMGGIINSVTTLNAGGNRFLDSLIVINRRSGVWKWENSRQDTHGKGIRLTHAALGTGWTSLANTGVVTLPHLTVSSSAGASVSGGIRIGYGADTVFLPANKQLITQDFSRGNLEFYHFFRQGSGLEQTLTLTDSSSLHIEASLFEGKLAVTTPVVSLVSSVFNQFSSFVKIGNLLGSLTDNVTFYDSISFQHQGAADGLLFGPRDSQLLKTGLVGADTLLRLIPIVPSQTAIDRNPDRILLKSDFEILPNARYSAIISQGENSSSSQTSPFAKILPPSPQAASLGRYGEIPVSLQNGIISPEIPLYTLQSGELSLAVKLRYHASGVRVNDIASSVGTGWALEAGGVVTRSIRGIPDESYYGLRNQKIPIDGNSSEFNCYAGSVAFGNLDGESDIFAYNFMGQAGQFMYANRQVTPNANLNTPVAVTFPYRPLDIQWDGDNQMNIKDENGTRYYFGRLDQQTAVESIVPYEPSGFSNAISAWYLLKVVAANGVDEIRFDYISSEGLIDTPLYSTQLLRTKDVNFNTVVGFEYQKQNYSTLTQVKYVSSITFKNGKVTFDYQTDRQDASNGAKRLKRVNVWAEENVGDYQLVRFFELAHSYFNCADGPTQSEYTVSSVHASTDWRLKRLRLDSVTEKSPANHALPPYSLTYYEDVPLPIYGAYAQDYWGFSNGASTNQNLLLWDAPNSSIEPSRQYGANREVSFTHALAGTLQQMTYPTQGKSVFVFEAPTKTNGTQVLQGGGIRIKRIINYDNTGGQTQKEYSYPGAYFTSNLYNGSFDGLDFHNLLFHTFEARGNNCCDNVPYQTKAYPENLHFPLGTNSGSSLTYNQVEELSLDAANVASGKRVLKYRVMQDESYSYMPFYHINNGWQRGDLLEESLYKTGESNTLLLLNQTSHQYHFHQENLKVFNLPARISFTPRIVTCSDFGQFTCIYSYLPLCPDSFLPTIAHQFEYFSFSQQVGRYFLESTVITQYDESGNNPITHTLNYEYGESTHHQITKKSFTNRNNQVVETRYRYPHEKAVSGNVYAEMLNQHIFTPLIEEELHVGGQLQQLSRTNYKGWYPVSASLHAFYAPYSLETQLAGGSLTLQYTMGESLVAPSENGYSTQAQPLVYTLRNGLTTRLEWHDEHGKFDLLKKTTTLHLFDTYDYQPLIGLGRQRNQTTLGSDFEYDGFGRLQTLRNAQNQVLKNYDYSYAGGVNTYNTVAERTARIETTNPADLTDVPNGRITLHHFDGLGRDAQTVEYKASPAFNDIVSQHISYDSYGRVQKTLLPVAMTGSSTVAWADPGSTAQSFYNGDVRPFAEIFYEASPLNRPKKSYGAGNTWFSNQKFVEKQYGTSSTTRRFELTANGLQKNGFYQHITTQTTISEQGHSVVEYFDVEGKLVQKDVQESAGNYLQTAYVYDELNRLKYVLQPKLYDWFNTNTILNEGQAEYQQGAFGYRYDTQGRLIEKHVPGGGKTEMVYDKYDRVVWQRTALGQELGKWTFLKYDALNRVIATGEKSESSERADLQEDADDSNLGHHEARINSDPVYYTLSNSYPTVVEDDLRTISYFDDYQNWPVEGMTFDDDNNYHDQYITVTGLPTGSRLRNSDNGHWLVSVDYYDDKGRVIQQFAHNLYDQIERTDLAYNFAGEILKSRHYRIDQNDAVTTQLLEHNYDHAGRKTALYQAINGETSEKLASYSYDAIGRMMQKKIMPDGTYSAGGIPPSIIRTPNPAANTTDAATKYVLLQKGTLIEASSTNKYVATITAPSGGTSISGLQTMDYRYHIRGGLLGINLDGSSNPTPNSSQGDLFSYKLEYETAETPYWDGNIGKQTWHNGTDSRNYEYTYDKASRLKSATYTGVNGEDYSLPNINYDLNGNITHLQRKGKVGSGFALMDNLTYTHVGNRLSQVTDAVEDNHEVDFVQRGSASYTYYNDGSLKSDDNEQIQTILYDSYLQQPIEIELTDDRKINHYYDGSGSLLKTVYSTGEVWEYTDGLIYKNGVPFQMTTPEGRAVFTPPSGAWGLEFFYQDHLGNSRIGFKANSTQLEKISETSFDPWGVVLRELGPINPIQNRFEMQGKEKENNFVLNRINFGARTLNPATVAWDRIDEYSEKYYSFSPYSYVANNPLKFIDTDGKKIFLVVSRDSKGSADLVLEYKNNKFYNQGKEYKSSAMTGFSSEVLATLNKIRGSDKYLDKVISTLESTSTNHFIEFSKDIAGSGVLGNTNDVSPKSSIMRIKLGDYNKPLDSGEQNTLGTTIAHELSHQYDRETGKQDINVPRKDEGTERDPNEIRAVNLENRYRVNNGIELRKNYGGRIDPNKLEDPKKPKQ